MKSLRSALNKWKVVNKVTNVPSIFRLARDTLLVPPNQMKLSIIIRRLDPETVILSPTQDLDADFVT